MLISSALLRMAKAIPDDKGVVLINATMVSDQDAFVSHNALCGERAWLPLQITILDPPIDSTVMVSHGTTIVAESQVGALTKGAWCHIKHSPATKRMHYIAEAQWYGCVVTGGVVGLGIAASSVKGTTTLEWSCDGGVMWMSDGQIAVNGEWRPDIVVPQPSAGDRMAIAMDTGEYLATLLVNDVYQTTFHCPFKHLAAYTFAVYAESGTGMRVECICQRRMPVLRLPT